MNEKSINPGDTVRLLSGGGTYHPDRGVHLVECKNDQIYKVGGFWFRHGATYVTLVDESNVWCGKARPEQLELLSKSNKKGAEVE